ncbi:YbhB/YbcL family Raf kinase inhibitor-like protein [Sorangium sp. So ce887]|uniref:YbhB/YbcL family Raf kinase inhibitor-like protein n=1 Tax=Sorangium sp. So ce887 TaxID=3133324 RepID=UPI003F5DCEEF
MTFQLTSPSFANGQPIPAHYTSDGEDVSPPLPWSDPPPGTKSFALVVHDPDAPDPKAPKRDWVHWVLYNVPADARSLPEGATRQTLPPGTREGLNDWGETGWRGPSPPIGRHRYFFDLYALDTELPDLGTPTRRELEAAMKGHVLAQAILMGTYAKRGQ